VDQLLAFTVCEQLYALYLSAVERVVRAVEVTALPQAPEIVLGVINAQGRILPVINLRKRLRLPEREINLSDRLIIGQTPRRKLALIADSVNGIITCSQQEIVAAEEILPRLGYVSGVIKLSNDIILIHDLDSFLSLEEEQALDRALR